DRSGATLAPDVCRAVQTPVCILEQIAERPLSVALSTKYVKHGLLPSTLRILSKFERGPWPVLTVVTGRTKKIAGSVDPQFRLGDGHIRGKTVKHALGPRPIRARTQLINRTNVASPTPDGRAIKVARRVRCETSEGVCSVASRPSETVNHTLGPVASYAWLQLKDSSKTIGATASSRPVKIA